MGSIEAGWDCALRLRELRTADNASVPDSWLISQAESWADDSIEPALRQAKELVALLEGITEGGALCPMGLAIGYGDSACRAAGVACGPWHRVCAILDHDRFERTREG